MKKYVKVMFGLTSGANGFQYKENEVNEAQLWNPNESDPKLMCGFNFSVEDKILRYLVRGDTICDVIVPKDAEIIDCPSESCPHGIFRSNKIIINNVRPMTDKMAMCFYENSNLPEKSYFKSMAGCAIRGYRNTTMKILSDKVNKKNIDLALEEVNDFIKPGYYWDKKGDKDLTNELLNLLNNIKNENS